MLEALSAYWPHILVLLSLTLGVPAASLAHLDRVLAQFESFCTVTESIRQGFPVTVQVFDSTGAALK